ncbi:uncharacterized protein LOC105701092 isoform X3 [Orussus abietinus]|uniref:uncharacterized protein LOC105701092 isoform X3 n=1 Tax=Orussus abietinus TaxID=222816 RepID=UPI000C715B7E|nr:uncharacterized protein LOC105701092 isoform X3 [Orussus abietinus]
MTAREVDLLGGSPWGFRMHGGHDLHQPLRISRVNPGSKAAQQGVREGDLISSINGKSTRNLTNSEAHGLLRNAGERLRLGLNQENVGSPKRRIYKSSLQESTSTETLKRTTTKSTTSSLRIISTEAKSNGTDDTTNGGNNYASQNGGLKNSEQRTDTSAKGYEYSDYLTDAEEDRNNMPHASRSRKNRRAKNRKRPQTSVLEKPSNEASKLITPTPDLSKVKDTPTPDLSKVNDTPTPDLSKVNDTPTPDLSKVNDTPTPDLSKVNDTPTPDLSKVNNTPTPVILKNGHQEDSISEPDKTEENLKSRDLDERSEGKIGATKVDEEVENVNGDESSEVSKCGNGDEAGREASKNEIDSKIRTNKKEDFTRGGRNKNVETCTESETQVIKEVNNNEEKSELSIENPEEITPEVSVNNGDHGFGVEEKEQVAKGIPSEDEKSETTIGETTIIAGRRDTGNGKTKAAARGKSRNKVSQEEEVQKAETKEVSREMWTSQRCEIGANKTDVKPAKKDSRGEESRQGRIKENEVTIITEEVREDERNVTRKTRRKPKNKCRIEVGALKTELQIVEITTIQTAPLEARIEHIPGVGIVETRHKKEEDEHIVTVVEPIEPLSISVATKVKTLGDQCAALAQLPKNNSFEIHEVSDSDVEADSSRVAVVVEVESDVEKDSVGDSIDLDKVAEEDRVEDLKGLYSNLISRLRDSDDGEDSQDLLEDTQEDSMSEEVEKKLRTFIEGLKLPSSAAEARDECRKVETERNPGGNVAARKAKKRAILESYFMQTQAANRFLDIIQEEGEKLSEDGEQHIRDFINGEIGKYRREERDFSHGLEEGLENMEDLEEEAASSTGAMGDVPELSEKVNRADIEKKVEKNVNESVHNGRKKSPESGNPESSDVEASNEIGEARIVPDDPRNRETSDPGELRNDKNGGTNSHAADRRNQTPSSRLPNLGNDPHLERPPTPPEVDYPREVREVPDPPQEVRPAPKTPPIPPTRGKFVNSQGSLEALGMPPLSPPPSPLPSPPPPPQRHEPRTNRPERIYETAPKSDVSTPRDDPEETTLRNQLTSERIQRKIRICESNVKSEQDAVEFIKVLLTVLSRKDTTRQDVQNVLTRFDINQLPQNIQDIIDDLMAPSSHVSMDSDSLDLRNSDQDCDAEVGSDTNSEIAYERINEVVSQKSLCVGQASLIELSRSEQNGILHEETKQELFKAFESAIASNKMISEKCHKNASTAVEVNGIEPEDGINTDKIKDGDKENGTVCDKKEIEVIQDVEHKQDDEGKRDQDAQGDDKNEGIKMKKEERDVNTPKIEDSKDSTSIELQSTDSKSPNKSEEAECSSSAQSPIDFQGLDSSSSATTLSTAKYNPRSSLADLSSVVQDEEKEGIKDKQGADQGSPQPKRKLTLLKGDEDSSKGSSKDGEAGSPQPIPYSPIEDLYYVPLDKTEEISPSEEKPEEPRPDSLKDLCVKKILSMPYGMQIINEITLPKFNIFKSLQVIQEAVNIASRADNERLNTHGVSRLVGSDREPTKTALGDPEDRHPAVSEQSGSDRLRVDERPGVGKPRVSNPSNMRKRPQTWVGVPTIQDPKLLVCLSPSQQETGVHASADNLLDLHKKYLERRSYHDDHRSDTSVHKYRIDLHLKDEEQPARVAPDRANHPDRWNTPWHVPKTGNRLLEIIKENSILPSDKKSSTPCQKSSFREFDKKSYQRDKDTISQTRISSQRLQDASQERLSATCLSDWLHLARRNSDDNAIFGQNSGLSSDRSRESGQGCFDKSRRNSLPGMSNYRHVGDSSGHLLPEDYDELYEQRSSSRVRNGRIGGEFKVEGMSEGTSEFGGVGKRSADRPHSVNNALIIRESGDGFTRSATPFRRSPISMNSAIIDKSPDTPDSGKRSVTSPRRFENVGNVRSNINSALIDDRPIVPPKVKKLVNVDRSCIDTTSIFDKSPPKNRLEPRRYHQDPEKTRNVKADEIVENLKRLQSEMKGHADERRRFSLPQEYFDRQLQYIEQLENQLKEEVLAEESGKEMDKACYSSGRGTLENRKTPFQDGMDEPSWKQKRTRQEETEGTVKLGKIADQDCQRSRDSWHEESRNVGDSQTEILKRDGYRESMKKVVKDEECFKEESETTESKEEYTIITKSERTSEPGTSRSSSRSSQPKSAISTNAANGDTFRQQMSGEVASHVQESKEERISPKTELTDQSTSKPDHRQKSSGLPRPKSSISAIPTNGEVFRQQMFNEYVNKVQERLERKHHKVIKISSHADLEKVENESCANMNKIEREFIEKARDRLQKFGIKLDESEPEARNSESERVQEDLEEARCVVDGQEVKDTRSLPKHLREFLKLSAADSDDGVWSPGSEPPPPPKVPSPDRGKDEKDAAIPPVWTPSSAGASPVPERKEFRPVPFESPILGRKKKPEPQSSSEETTVPWKEEGEKKESSHTVSQNVTSRIVTSLSAPPQGLNTLAGAPRLPRAQNPTITLLQKAREGQLPKGAAYLDENESASRNSSDSKPLISPGEVVYTVKREYESEPEVETQPPKKMADLGPRKLEGIGPITKEGIPLVLRSEVKENNQAKWYKKMYDSLHRSDKDDDYITIRYKPRRGARHGYGSSSGYLSEPEPRYSERSATLDSRRRPRNKENDFSASTMPRKNGPLKYSSDSYRNQPGRIEDYEPGRSSIAEKETKEWWDEVMDIFDGPFEHHRSLHAIKPYMTQALKESGYESDSTLVFRRRDDVSPLSPLEQRLAYKTVQKGGDVPLHGLRKPAPERPKDDSEIEYFPISPTLTRIRVHRKLAQKSPHQKSKSSTSSSEMVFGRYKKTTPAVATTLLQTNSKTDSRTLPGKSYSSSRITSPPPGRPPSRVDSPQNRPPSPPRRRSSRNNSTLRLYSKTKVSNVTSHSANPRHEQCFSADNVSNIRFLRDRLSCKLEKHRKEREDAHRVRMTRTSSTSPVVARTKVSTEIQSGKSEPCLVRNVSSESSSRTGVEKVRTRVSTSTSPASRTSRDSGTKVEGRRCPDERSGKRVPSKSPMSISSRESTIDRLTSPERTCSHGSSSRISTVAQAKMASKCRKITKKEQEETCKRLSRSPELISPTEVQKIVQKQKDSKDASTRTLPSGTVLKSSTTLYSSSLNSKHKNPEDKSLKVTVAITSKGREFLRRNTETTSTNPSSRTSSATTSPLVSRKATTLLQPTESTKLRAITRQSDMEKMKSETLKVLPPPSLADNTSDLNRKKRSKERLQTIVKSAIKKPETITIDPEDKDQRTEKKKKKEKNSETSKSKKISNGKKSDSEKKQRKSKNPSDREDISKRCHIGKKKVEVTADEITRHGEVMKSNTFFQNLFLRNVSPTPSQSSVVRKNSVLERVKIFQEGRSDRFRSEPSLRSINIYLSHKRPVSNSKFKNWEHESSSSRSSSPYGVCWPGRSVFKKISKFESLLSVDEYPPDYRSTSSLRSRSPDFSREVLKGRSSSEPPLRMLPEDKEKSPKASRTSSPSPARSDIPQRVQSLKTPESLGTFILKKARARSVGEADQRPISPKQRFGSSLSLTRSTSSLMSSQVDREDSHQYVLEMLHYRRKSKRYRELHDFYASLERMGELERTTSTGDLRPRLRNEEIIDYDRWKEVRTKERAERELKILYDKLQAAQKEKDFLFRPKDVERYRWRGDSGLRCKEKSVENIREHFKKLENEESELESSRRREISSKKDVYKPLWRGSTVMNVANTIIRKAAESHAESDRSVLHPSLQRSLGGSKKFWSSLSVEQVNTLKNQLNEIYGSENGKSKTSISKADYEIVVPPKEGGILTIPQEEVKGLHVRCHSLLGSDNRDGGTKQDPGSGDRLEPTLKRSNSIGRGRTLERSQSDRVVPPMSELEKKRLSLTLSQEILDKVSKRKPSGSLQPRETRGAFAAALAIPKGSTSARSTSPRTCYSLEMSEDGATKSKEKNDFLLVLAPDSEGTAGKKRVENVLEEWSKKSAPTSSAPTEDGTSKTSRPTSGSEVESNTESSDASVRTVIHQTHPEEVPRKVDFFEHVGEERNEPRKPPKYVGHPHRLSSSQSFADLKELFGERESAKYGTIPLFRSRARSTSPGSPPTSPGSHQCARLRDTYERTRSVSPRTVSTSSCSLDSIWQRSSSPDPEKYWRAYLKLVKSGAVKRLRAKFESLEELHQDRNRVVQIPKRFQSDPELTRNLLKRGNLGNQCTKAVVKIHECSDVNWLRRKYEPIRGRTRKRGTSPIPKVPLRLEDLGMPRINVISKLAELKDSVRASSSASSSSFMREAETRELRARRPVGKVRKRFERDQERGDSGEVFSSSPSLHELRDIAPYLAGRWVAHKYPRRHDNARSLSSPDLSLEEGSGKGPEGPGGGGVVPPRRHRSPRPGSEKPRASSASPVGPRRPTSILKHPNERKDPFADQHFDPSKHRPRYRYQPPPPSPPAARRNFRPWWPPLPTYTARPTVTFEGPDHLMSWFSEISQPGGALPLVRSKETTVSDGRPPWTPDAARCSRTSPLSID